MFDRRLLQHFDWVLLLLLVLIGIVSVLNLYSATYPLRGSEGPRFSETDLLVPLGHRVMLLMTTFDYHGLERVAYPAYFLSLVFSCSSPS